MKDEFENLLLVKGTKEELVQFVKKYCVEDDTSNNTNTIDFEKVIPIPAVLTGGIKDDKGEYVQITSSEMVRICGFSDVFDFAWHCWGSASGPYGDDISMHLRQINTSEVWLLEFSYSTEGDTPVFLIRKLIEDNKSLEIVNKFVCHKEQKTGYISSYDNSVFLDTSDYEYFMKNQMNDNRYSFVKLGQGHKVQEL